MPQKKPKCEHKCSFHFSSLIEEGLESHRANTGSTAPRNDLPRQEGKPGGAPFEVQLPEIRWQPTFKESRRFLPSAWPPSFPGSWADLAALWPAVCELWQPVQVRDREVVEKGGGGRAVGGGGWRAQWRQGKEDAGFPWSQPYQCQSKTELPRGA